MAAPGCRGKRPTRVSPRRIMMWSLPPGMMGWRGRCTMWGVCWRRRVWMSVSVMWYSLAWRRGSIVIVEQGVV